VARVVERAYDVPAGERPGQVETPGLEAGGDHQPVPGEALPALKGHRAHAEVGRDHPVPEPPRHLTGVSGNAEGETGVVGLLLAGERLLRQRWPVVGHVPLIPDDDDLTGEPVLGHRLGGAQAAQRCPDDDDARHRLSPR
jgi:hypothetical protein